MPDSSTHLSIQSWPCCQRQGLSPVERQQQRLSHLATLGLGDNHSVAVFEEAAQLAAHFLQTAIAWVSVADASVEYLKGAYGLSRLGLSHDLLQGRQLSLYEGLSQYVLDSGQPLVLSDIAAHPVLAQAPLMAENGLVSYCGVPLVTSDHHCIGTLAVMDFKPRSLTERDISFLAMTARWAMADYERYQLTNAANDPSTPTAMIPAANPGVSPVDSIRLHLISQLTQDLRSPLTAVLGMASMLKREIYGPLTPKQREYTEIVCDSSQTVMTLVDEIIELGWFDAQQADLAPTAVDIQQLGQQVMAILQPMAEKRVQTLMLTVEPTEHQWILDKRTVKQILYHLVFSVMQMAGDNSTIRLHASRKGDCLSLAIWLANPWVGEGLPANAVEFVQGLEVMPQAYDNPAQSQAMPVEIQGLLLSQHLTQRHRGQIHLQGTADMGHRIVILLPNLEAKLTCPEKIDALPLVVDRESDSCFTGLCLDS
jgi:signal transduction histidine kinase